jgi:hypothetical protein
VGNLITVYTGCQSQQRHNGGLEISLSISIKKLEKIFDLELTRGIKMILREKEKE